MFRCSGFRRSYRDRGRPLIDVAETVGLVETTGATFRLDGEKVRVWYTNEQNRDELAQQVSFLRSHREEVAAFLRIRATMPPGIHLIAWKLKEPPVALDSCSVVTDPAKFARTSLEQLRIALAQPKRWVGWSVPQLIERLGKVGVAVALESTGTGN